jgi:hypothetical protein
MMVEEVPSAVVDAWTGFVCPFEQLEEISEAEAEIPADVEQFVVVEQGVEGGILPPTAQV